METVYKTPLGFATICGDEHGVSSITVSSDDGIITSSIPKDLQEVVSQLNDYFEGTRTSFDCKLNSRHRFPKKSLGCFS
jgi:methylated-DNA-[protein]-cysteine S-methyltransferase